MSAAVFDMLLFAAVLAVIVENLIFVAVSDVFERFFPPPFWPHSGELRTQSLNVLLLKPGVGQYIAIHAVLTARGLFLAYFYPSGPVTCISPQLSHDFSCVGCG